MVQKYDIDGVYTIADCGAKRRVQTLPNGDLRVAGTYRPHEATAAMAGTQWVASFTKTPKPNFYRTKFGVSRASRGGPGLHTEYNVVHDTAIGTLTLTGDGNELPIVWRLETLPGCLVTVQKAGLL